LFQKDFYENIPNRQNMDYTVSSTQNLNPARNPSSRNFGIHVESKSGYFFWEIRV
jgi:hypothetical protein